MAIGHIAAPATSWRPPKRTIVFPVEVLERIIDFCAHPDTFPLGGIDESRDALRAWSLTHRILLRRCRMHLWREIILRDELGVNNLLQALRSDLHISTYIQSLTVWFETPSSVFTSLMNARLAHLRYIRLHSEPVLFHKVFFKTMQQFKNITVLWTSGRMQAHHLMRLLCCFPNLQFLHMANAEECLAPVPHAKHYSPKFKLECLHLYFANADSQIAAWRYISRCLSNTPTSVMSLKILDIIFDPCDLHLRYWHDNADENAATMINEITFPSLRECRSLRRLFIIFNWSIQKRLPGLLHLLETIYPEHWSLWPFLQTLLVQLT
ncbi:unnamed protein product [Somion occarium]|uniref:F-box domain-containing protein n=1 Tax=Somion occarium TaxID=3059160 RepID=A0ABP1DHT9_9APHY